MATPVLAVMIIRSRQSQFIIQFILFCIWW